MIYDLLVTAGITVGMAILVVPASALIPRRRRSASHEPFVFGAKRR